jgi:hypothetical protein
VPDLSQSDVLVFVVTAVVLIVVAYFSFRKHSGYVDLVDHPPDERPGLHLDTSWPSDRAPTATERAAADAQFDEGFRGGMWHFVDRYFHTKIAGAKFPNDDGSNRAAYIRRCKPLEPLVIQWDKGNPHDYYAKIVRRQSGEQLGFLLRGIAEEIHSDFSVPGVTWLGIFKSTNHHPDTGQVVGAVILLARMTPEKRAQAEKKIADAENPQPVRPRRPRAASKRKAQPSSDASNASGDDQS